MRQVPFENQPATKGDVAALGEHMGSMIAESEDNIQGEMAVLRADNQRQLSLILEIVKDTARDVKELKPIGDRVEKIENQLYNEPAWVRMPVDIIELKEKVFKRK